MIFAAGSVDYSLVDVHTIESCLFVAFLAFWLLDFLEV